METVLGALLATVVEFVLLALIVAPRWTLRKLASLPRGVRSRFSRTRRRRGARAAPTLEAHSGSTRQ